MTLTSILLYPAAIIYSLVMRVRTILYQTGFLKRSAFTTPVLAIGNLVMGGSGKTPMVEFITTMLSSKGFAVAILSRGYKRHTNGFVAVDPKKSVGDVGDEPLQIFNLFDGRIPVFVCENRTLGINNILDLIPGLDCILLDDAYQHLAVKPSLNLLLTTYQYPFYRDHILPSGRLREPRREAVRADVVIVTKCPDNIPDGNMEEIRIGTNRYIRPQTEVLWSYMIYDNLIPVNHATVSPNKIVLVTAIADALPLRKELETRYLIEYHFDFPDHHSFSNKNIRNIVETCLQTNSATITTSKDAIKLEAHLSKFDNIPVFVQPVRMAFHRNGAETLYRVLSANLPSKDYIFNT